MSINDGTDGDSGDIFISPLVKIRQQTEVSISVTTGSPSAREGSVSNVASGSQNFDSRGTTTNPSCHGGHETLISGGFYQEQQPFGSGFPDIMDSFVGAETWDFGDANMSTELFDSLREMRPNS
jgi:hypothetical protein